MFSPFCLFLCLNSAIFYQFHCLWNYLLVKITSEYLGSKNCANCIICLTFHKLVCLFNDLPVGLLVIVVGFFWLVGCVFFSKKVLFNLSLTFLVVRQTSHCDRNFSLRCDIHGTCDLWSSKKLSEMLIGSVCVCVY